MISLQQFYHRTLGKVPTTGDPSPLVQRFMAQAERSLPFLSDLNLVRQFEREADALKQVLKGKREAISYRIEAVRTAMMVTGRELAATPEEVAGRYEGISEYRRALPGRLRALERIERKIAEGKPLSPRQQETLERLILSYFGEAETGFKSHWQRHLDLLTEARKEAATSEASSDDPLLGLVREREAVYLAEKARLVESEKEHEGDTALMVANQQALQEIARPYYDAIAAYYLLHGHIPTTWRGDWREMRRQASWQPTTWTPPMLVGVVTSLIGPFGVKPTSWDGALFPPVEESWSEGGTLTLRPTYMPAKTGLSLGVLGSALLETMQIVTALTNTTDLTESGHHFDAITAAWLHSVLTMAGCTLEVTGLEHLNGIRGANLMITSTHRGFVEFPIILGLSDKFGRPIRIIGKDQFRRNPILVALVGLAMKAYGFPFIDREHGEKARDTMRQAGELLRNGQVSVAFFPGASRSPTLVFERDGKRVRAEGPLYASKSGVGEAAASKSGVGEAAAASKKAPIVPVVIQGAGIVTPKSMREQARGVVMGETLNVTILPPFLPETLRGDREETDSFGRRLAARLDETFRETSGLPTGPLYRSGPKTIFQAGNLEDLEKALAERAKKRKGGIKHEAVVFVPQFPQREDEPAQIIALLERLGEKVALGGRLTVYHAVETSDGYRFPSYDVVRNGDHFEVVRGIS